MTPEPRIDPGAEAVASAIRAAVNWAGAGPSMPTTVRVGEFRNQSRASRDEFAGAIARFAEALSPAVAQRSVDLIADAGMVAEFELGATVYLIRDQDHDWWEFYLNLSRTSDGSALWQSDGPVRLRREIRSEPTVLVYPVQRRR